MDNLKIESLDWAITHIRRFGDTDLFPIPFEYEAIRHSWLNLKRELSQLDIGSHEGRPARRFLVPKQYGGYRVAIQLDPIDTIIYTALAYEAADAIDKYRIPTERKVACSYRVQLGPKGELFRKNNGWDDFHEKSTELATSRTCHYVVTADIADFYNQIGHHRIRNALETAGIEKNRSKNIENLLMNFTGGQSKGIPIGPAASNIFAEACLSDVDSFALRRGFVYTRYVDDFRIFCMSEEHAYQVLHDLTEYLYTSHRLALQSHKTRVLPVEEFITRELIDPEELENKTKEEKIEALNKFFSGYADFENEECEDDFDLDEIIRDNLVELFQNSLTHEPIHLGLTKYILRRATALKTGMLRDTVLDNVDKLIPVIRESALYISATTQHSKAVRRKFVDSCRKTNYSFLPFLQLWLVEVLLNKMIDSMEADIGKLCDEYKANLGSRPFAMLAKEKKYIDWVRAQKETWQNNNPWDKRAIIWASQALSHDECNYWLRRVQNADDILDKAIAEAVRNIRNS